MDGTVAFYQSSISTRIISFLNYLRTTIRANYLVSALNTNLLIYIDGGPNQYTTYGWQVTYTSDTVDKPGTTVYMTCSNQNPILPVSFYSLSLDKLNYLHLYGFMPLPNATVVSGFFGGCTPLESLLQSTLDCLYDINCLHLLLNYFPSLEQVCMT